MYEASVSVHVAILSQSLRFLSKHSLTIGLQKRPGNEGDGDTSKKLDLHLHVYKSSRS